MTGVEFKRLACSEEDKIEALWLNEKAFDELVVGAENYVLLSRGLDKAKAADAFINGGTCAPKELVQLKDFTQEEKRNYKDLKGFLNGSPRGIKRELDPFKSGDLRKFFDVYEQKVPDQVLKLTFPLKALPVEKRKYGFMALENTETARSLLAKLAEHQKRQDLSEEEKAYLKRSIKDLKEYVRNPKEKIVPHFLKQDTTMLRPRGDVLVTIKCPNVFFKAGFTSAAHQKILNKMGLGLDTTHVLEIAEPANYNTMFDGDVFIIKNINKTGKINNIGAYYVDNHNRLYKITGGMSTYNMMSGELTRLTVKENIEQEDNKAEVRTKT